MRLAGLLRHIVNSEVDDSSGGGHWPNIVCWDVKACLALFALFVVVIYCWCSCEIVLVWKLTQRLKNNFETAVIRKIHNIVTAIWWFSRQCFWISSAPKCFIFKTSQHIQSIIYSQFNVKLDSQSETTNLRRSNCALDPDPDRNPTLFLGPRNKSFLKNFGFGS